MKWRTLVVTVVLTIVITLGSTGGAVRGGTRFSSSGRYTSTGSSTRSYRSAFSGNRLSSSSSIRSALFLGNVYGAWSYRQRARFLNNGKLPEICYNDSYNMSTNGTISYQGRFFCPINENMTEDYRYCCGEEGQQYCCRFWDSADRVAAAIIGILLAVGGMFALVFYVLKCIKLAQKKSKNNSNGQLSYRNCGFTSTPRYSRKTFPNAELATKQDM